jgi:S-adenosylmethionine:tRNA ribosyltransferase-isomerase
VEALESVETRVDSSPARAHQVDEKSQVVDPSLPLGEQLAFDALETTQRMVEEAADFRDVPRHWKNLGAEPVANGIADVNRDRRLELCRGGGECLDLLLRPLERSLELGRARPPLGGIRNTLLRPFQSGLVHERRGYSQRRMDSALLDYELPPELVAQRPAVRRDASRLLVLRSATGAVEHRVFAELPELLEGELVVLNDTRVVPGRLRLQRATGGSVEVLLVERVDGVGLWEALVRPERRLRRGERLGPAELIEPLGDGRWLVRYGGAVEGEVPLPPYIHEPLHDPERYQTVFAREDGSAAAPTAGLHFTRELLDRLDYVSVTLHVGLDTFRPVKTVRLEDHGLHGERYCVDPDVWRRIASSSRVLAVGTTSVRVLETVVRTGELEGRTTLFITPGFEFRRVDALLTNFHLPRSTLLALVMAFVGVGETRALYRTAVQESYRFYSFGDAMLVL